MDFPKLNTEIHPAGFPGREHGKPAGITASLFPVTDLYLGGDSASFEYRQPDSFAIFYSLSTNHKVLFTETRHFSASPVIKL